MVAPRGQHLCQPHSNKETDLESKIMLKFLTQHRNPKESLLKNGNGTLLGPTLSAYNLLRKENQAIKYM